MNSELSAHLEGSGQRLAVEKARWAWQGADLELEIAYYTAKVLPPPRFVTSVRAVVIRGDEVLVALNADGRRHVIPGGRLEKGEEMLAALRREILEETGWSFSSCVLLGVMHYRHLSPCPLGYPYPYPEFAQVVYVVTADTYDASRRDPGDYEQKAEFVSISDAINLPLPEGQKRYLGLR